MVNKAPEIKWPGVTGQYSYFIFPISTEFVNSPGNYIFARESSPNRWTPVYIGQTNDLGNRLSNHEKRQLAIRCGATHIHVHKSGHEMLRLAEERDLLTRWRPSCNVQGV